MWNWFQPAAEENQFENNAALLRMNFARAPRRTTLTAYLGYTQGLSVMELIYPQGKNGQFGYLEFFYRF